MNRRLLLPLAILALFLGRSEFAFALTGFVLGDAANYAVIYQAGGTNHLNINNGVGTMNSSVNGNIGIANSPSTGCPTCTNDGRLQLSGPETINGNVDFSGAYTQGVQDNGPYSGNIVVNGTRSGGHTNVRTDMDTLTALSSTLGAEMGTSVALNTGATINAASGMVDGSGNEVFTVSGISAANGTLTINGDGIHNVVFNISAAHNGDFHFNNIVLGGGLTSDNVLFNWFGGSNESGGPTMNVNANSSSSNSNVLYGTFLDPNGAISVVNTILDGRVFGGDSTDEAIVSGAQINAPTTVPDAGATVLLMGLGLAFLAGAKRKFRS